MNLLYYGDNLAVLRRHIADESVDVIYLDPPFNSTASDNVLFAERDVRPAPLRIKAFEDTWRWDEGAAGAYEEVMQAGGQVMLAMRAFWRFLGDTDLLAYLAMLTPRLVELRRVLKPTGSIYLHCDPTASHYLKMLMDAVFGASGFRNEIICKRNAGHGDTSHPSNRFGNSTDTILFYAKTGTNVFHSQPIQTLWDDIEMIGPQSAERLGYPTQKPEALLERIIRASSSEGAVVLDPFCGGGTTLATAHRLQRHWIGIDMTHLAIALVRHRLRGAYGDEIEQTYRVIGGPASVADAKELAASDQDQFQWWALGLVGAHPNARIYFHDGDGTTRHIILSVKAGKLHPSDVRDLRGIVDREQAAIGVLLTLSEPTKAMQTKAASAGFYQSRGRQHPRLQVVTVGELLGGKRLDIPAARSTCSIAI